jgi:hypothetical protein
VAESLVPVLIALQFAAFGWRVNREIAVGDQKRRTWFPVPNILNIMALLSVVAACVLTPLATQKFDTFPKTVLSIGYALIALHPINVAAHYRLFSRDGRSVYINQGEDYPYLTDHEKVTLVITLLVTVAIGLFVYYQA